MTTDEYEKRDLRWKWISALRSGKYEQGFSALCNEGTHCEFCCLGVLIDVIDPDGWEPKETSSLRAHHLAEFGDTKFPAPDVMRRVGLTRGDAALLSGLNDVDDHSFEDIAALLEILPYDE